MAIKQLDALRIISNSLSKFNNLIPAGCYFIQPSAIVIDTRKIHETRKIIKMIMTFRSAYVHATTGEHG